MERQSERMMLSLSPQQAKAWFIDNGSYSVNRRATANARVASR
jgi:hypothetical protein